MNVKYQVFISSTFQDLREERRVLMEQILNLKHIPVGMELFQASNQEQWTYIKKRILECDYYLLIVADRYGSIGEHGKSYTQMEYEFAVSSGIPVAAFLLDDAVRAARRADFVEHERKVEITNFRKLCSGSKLVKFWRDPADLALKATNALLGLIEDEPRQGWVRADQSVEAAYRELAKLAEEKRELQERLATLEGASKLIAPPDIRYHMDKMLSVTVSSFVTDEDELEEFKPLDLLDVFVKQSRKLARGGSMDSLAWDMMEMCEAKGNSYPLFARLIMEEFAAFGLIEISASSCSMTDYGRRLLMFAENRLEDIWSREDVTLP
jgi:hypothetical protein